LPIENCDERIIAENITACIDVPHYRQAIMDGFAVIASETLGDGMISNHTQKQYVSIDSIYR